MTTVTLPELALKDRVLAILEHHQGRANAITSYDLALALGLSRNRAVQRKLQLIIRELRKEGKPVLATCSIPYGYYYASTWAEVQDCLASLRSRLIEDALTRRDIKVGAGLYFENAEKVRLL